MLLSRFSMTAALMWVLCYSHVAFAGSYTNPVVEQTIEPDPYDLIQNWEGAYVGLTAGYAFGGDDRIGIFRNDVWRDSFGPFEDEGWNGSVRVGYRWQTDNWIYGPELAFEGGNIGDSFLSGGYSGETRVSNAFSLRLKAGGTHIVPDTMLYGIAGLSHASIDYSVVGSGGIGDIAIDSSYGANGYILGVGLEKMLSEKLSVTGEYEYTNYGSNELTDMFDASTKATPFFQNVKLGLNLRF